MKTRKGKKIMALVMAMLMVIGIMPMDWAAEKVVAADTTTYTLETSALTSASAGTYSDGDEVKAGTDNYFTLMMSAKTKIDSSSKTFDDGYESGQRLNLGGLATTAKNAVKITTGNAAKIKIWWVEGGDDNRQMALLNAAGEQVAVTDVTLTKNATAISELSVDAAGTYYIGGATNNNYIFKITVEEQKEAVAQDKVSILDTAADLAAAAQGTYTDGQEVKAGTDNYFTLIMSAKTKIDSSSKTFDDGYESGQRLNLGGLATTAKNAVKFTTEGAATVKIWWVEGGDDNRQMALLNAAGEQVAVTDVTLAKNATAISELSVADAGTYYLGGATNNNYIFKVEVTEKSEGSTPVEVKDWAEVAAPVITSVELKDASTLSVNYDMVIGKDGADKIEIDVKDAAGNVLKTLTSSAEGTSGSRTFEPEASGDYTFAIRAIREGEENKTGVDKTFTGFALPLTTPSFSSATSEGNGTIGLVWNEVKEATSYNVSYSTDGKVFSDPVSVTGTEYDFTGLAVGTKYTFKLTAVRSNPAAESESTIIEATATAESQMVWSFSAFGQGVSTGSNAGYEGNANDGSVKVWSTGGKGKIVPASTDGLSFYYTAVPTNMNFTLSATVTVDSWTYSNGQEGFGMMAADRVGTNGDSSVFWNNSYMASITKVEYQADADGNIVDAGNKISMKLGVGSQEKTGVTKENLSKLEANDTATVTGEFKSTMTTLETSQATKGVGTYNLVGNYTNTDSTFAGTVVENPKTTFKMTIQRNNTGYFVSYTDEDGNTVTNKYYDTTALDKLDTDNVYVGFFASRNATATFSDISLVTVDPSQDQGKEEQPITEVTPSYNVVSSSVANSEDYTIDYVANADGQLVVKDAAGNVIAEQVVEAGKKYSFATKLSMGANSFTLVMTPVEGYKPSEYEVLSSYEPVTITKSVEYNNFTGDLIYVSPDGKSSAAGNKENPTDIYTAVKFAKAGQKIILAGGTYNLESTVTIPRGIDGTADNNIVMMADPDATERPAFDFGRNCEGLVIAGDYWYLQGFDVTNSANGKDGIRLCGSNNTVDNVMAYHNGNTGLQISRYVSTDLREDWPANNLVLNCTSYGNADAGYEDADGFAAKLTIGDGNVFDGCIAYNNADDGWDLFAKVETGNIGSVTIRNCVAYANGYLEDGTNAGNGNGFKMGGSSLSGYHKLINSVAFDNKAKGIDSNSCPDIQVTNCISYNNQGSNVALYTNDSANTDFMATGVISYRTKFTNVGETFKLKGTQDTSKVYQENNYFWNYTGTGSKNSNGLVTDDWFVSVDTKMNYDTHVYSELPVTRTADNLIDMKGLLVLTEKANAATEGKAGAQLNTYDGKYAGIVSTNISATGNYSEGLIYKKATGSASDANSVTGSASGASSSASGVQSGDTRNIAIFILLAVISAVCVFALTRKKRA